MATGNMCKKLVKSGDLLGYATATRQLNRQTARLSHA